MTTFNPITKSEFKSRNSLFPDVPKPHPQCFLMLVSSSGGKPMPITDKTTPSDIRKGKFDQSIEINLTKHNVTLTFMSPSNTGSFKFEIQMDIKVWVSDPVVFYHSFDNDLVHNSVWRTVGASVRSITSTYAIKDYNIVGDALATKFFNLSCNNPDAGINYDIQNVTCEPYGKEAKTHVETLSRVDLESEILRKSEDLRNTNTVSAIWSQVGRGNITSEEAINRISNYQQENFNKTLDNAHNYMNVLSDMRAKGIMNDSQYNEAMQSFLIQQGLPTGSSTPTKQLTQNDNKGDVDIDWEE
jgi:hypothetical protein